MSDRLLVALGGNVLVKPGQEGTIQEQVNNLDTTLAQLIDVIRDGHLLVITHGNGPQVGHILIRVEEAHHKAYDLPLDVCVAQSQGEMGYLIQQRLLSLLHYHQIPRSVIALVSKVFVDKNDPHMQNPTKPIGPFYAENQIAELKARGYSIANDAHRGYRRMVPSPLPLRILEIEVIQHLFENGHIVIAVGGGGIPVSHTPNRGIEGVEAVIDKDWSSSLLAQAIGVDCMLNLTGVEHVKLNFGSSEEQNLATLSVQQAKQYLAEGHFLPGSMGPKIESAIAFLENGGREVIITSSDKATQGWAGETGTHLYPETE